MRRGPTSSTTSCRTPRTASGTAPACSTQCGPTAPTSWPTARPTLALRTAVADGVGAELVWARRGLLDEPQGLYDEGRLAALDLPDGVRTTEVDANHYDVILGDRGVAAVADALDRQLRR